MRLSALCIDDGTNTLGCLPLERTPAPIARFSYVSVIAADGRVDAIINQGVRATDAVIKIVDCWTVRDGKVTSIWVAYLEPQALLEKLGIAHGLGH